jgi:hypothetical protein
MTVLDETEEAGCTVSDLRVALTGRNIDVVDEINLELRPGRPPRAPPCSPTRGAARSSSAAP